MPLKKTFERLGDAIGLLILLTGLLIGANLLGERRRGVVAERRVLNNKSRLSTPPRRSLKPAL